MPGDTITIRTSPEVTEAITELAQAMERSRNWVIEAALKNYIELQSWQVKGIKAALTEVDSGEVDPHEQVFTELKKELSERLPK